MQIVIEMNVKENKEQKHKELTLERNEALQKRFGELHDVERLRYDDCIKQLSKEFFLRAGYIERLLKM